MFTQFVKYLTDTLISVEVRVARAARAIRIGTLHPAIVLYDEPHPLGDNIGSIESSDLIRKPNYHGHFTEVHVWTASDPFPAQVFMQALAERAGACTTESRNAVCMELLGPTWSGDLEQRMGDMRVGGGGPGSRRTADYGASPRRPVGVRSRRNSMSIMPRPDCRRVTVAWRCRSSRRR